MEQFLSLPVLVLSGSAGLVGLFFGSMLGRQFERNAMKNDLDRAEAFKINAAFDLQKTRRDCQEIAKLAVGIVGAADWAEETVKIGKDKSQEPDGFESDELTTSKMVVWNGTNKCPGCGRTGTSGIKCNNCGTIGCSDGNCKIGGTSGSCKVCQKKGTKVRI